MDVTLQVYKTATLPVKVNFINAPRGFDNSVLSYALSCKQLKVAGPAEKIDALSTLSIGTIDLSTFSLNKVYEMPIELPTDIYLLDNISTITVSFDCSGLETKTMNLPSSCVQVVNLPATYQLTVETERLMNVILCGPKGAMETLTPSRWSLRSTPRTLPWLPANRTLPAGCMYPPTARSLHWAAMCCNAALKATKFKGKHNK